MPAQRLPDGHVRLWRGGWSGTFPGDELDRWIAFYERMAARHRHPSYREDAEALRALRDGG